jgi:aspartate/methionine/tyrosine aminotransferase
MKELSAAIRAMDRSGIRVIMDLAAQQRDVLNLSVGEPDFQTPPHVIEAAAKAMADGYTSSRASWRSATPGTPSSSPTRDGRTTP